MDRPVFEVRRCDAAGRLGRLEIPRADVTIETPAMLPVVNLNHQLIEPARLAEEFGAEILITNAYLINRDAELRQAALERGLHELLGFPGAIMTDSGSFQLAEYGDVDINTEEILAFQDAIGSDIATPVDIPTPPDADRERATSDLNETNAAIATAAAYAAGDMLVSAPVQGGRFPELRKQSAEAAYDAGLDVYPVGAMVPLLRAYRFDDVVSLVGAAKRGLGEDVPVHLFGAGHPMMFSLGVAMGCDLFDSAAYALYAREDRYLTATGTVQLEDLSYLPCACPVCVETTPARMRGLEETERERVLTEHNLYVTFAEIRRVKQAIQQGELLELVEARARAHPGLLDGYRSAITRSDQLEASDTATGQRPFFYLSSESAGRPEVRRHHERLARLEIPERLTLVDPAIDDSLPREHPWTDSLDVSGIVEVAGDEWWYVIPPFGPVPPALLETYPLTAELPQRRDLAAYHATIEGIHRLHAESLTVIHANWPEQILIHLDAHTCINPLQDGKEDSSGRAADHPV